MGTSVSETFRIIGIIYCQCLLRLVLTFKRIMLIRTLESRLQRQASSLQLRFLITIRPLTTHKQMILHQLWVILASERSATSLQSLPVLSQVLIVPKRHFLWPITAQGGRPSADHNYLQPSRPLLCQQRYEALSPNL